VEDCEIQKPEDCEIMIAVIALDRIDWELWPTMIKGKPGSQIGPNFFNVGRTFWMGAVRLSRVEPFPRFYLRWYAETKLSSTSELGGFFRSDSGVSVSQIGSPFSKFALFPRE
jgi:hypothetical protein